MDQFYNYCGNISGDTLSKNAGASYETYYQFKHAKARDITKLQLCNELRALAGEDLVGNEK